MNSFAEILLIAIFMSAACALPGNFLVLRRMSMLTDAISHTVLLGIVLAFLAVGSLDSPLLIIGASLMGVLTVWLIELLYQSRLVASDSAIGLIFPLLFSIAVILVTRYAGNVHLDTDCILLGELAFAPFDRLIINGMDLGAKGLYTGGAVLAFVIFFYLPVLAFSKLNSACSNALTPWQGTIEGVMKILIFVIYIAIVSQMKDIKRTFMYHGAEHKSIACYEAGKELTVDNVRNCCRFHPRCGTSFIFVMLIFSIIFSTILSKIFPAIAQIRVLWMFLKLAFIPLIMGVGYEFIKYAGRHDNLLVKILSAPGLWMQRLTTKEPSDDIIEVGIESLKAVITENPEDDEIK